MKKMIMSLLAGLLLAGCWWQKDINQTNGPGSQPSTDSESSMPAQEMSADVVRIVINGPEPIAAAYEEEASGSTALALLEKTADQYNLNLTKKEYDFGTLVEGIGDVINSPERAWIYFVNGESASTGAGEYVVQPGDVIEWKYIEPIY